MLYYRDQNGRSIADHGLGDHRFGRPAAPPPWGMGAPQPQAQPSRPAPAHRAPGRIFSVPLGAAMIPMRSLVSELTEATPPPWSLPVPAPMPTVPPVLASPSSNCTSAPTTREARPYGKDGAWIQGYVTWCCNKSTTGATICKEIEFEQDYGGLRGQSMGCPAGEAAARFEACASSCKARLGLAPGAAIPPASMDAYRACVCGQCRADMPASFPLNC